MNSNDPTAWLPPRPDPQTGEPRPPHAPLFMGKRTPVELDPNRETRLSRKPQPPEGQGPVLAWYAASWRGAISFFVGMFVLLFVISAIVSLTKGGDLRLFRYWFPWAIIIVFSLLAAIGSKKQRCAAGADWFMLKTSWVKTYELSEIKMNFRSNTHYIYLTDKDGRKLDEQINLFQQDRLIWDLVYNGILHSIAHGAELKGSAGRYFKLPPVGRSGEQPTNHDAS